MRQRVTAGIGISRSLETGLLRVSLPETSSEIFSPLWASVSSPTISGDWTAWCLTFFPLSNFCASNPPFPPESFKGIFHCALSEEPRKGVLVQLHVFREDSGAHEGGTPVISHPSHPPLNSEVWIKGRWSKGTHKSPSWSHAPEFRLISAFRPYHLLLSGSLSRNPGLLPAFGCVNQPGSDTLDMDTLPLELCMYGDFANIVTKTLYEGIWFTSDFLKTFTALCANAHSPREPECYIS